MILDFTFLIIIIILQLNNVIASPTLPYHTIPIYGNFSENIYYINLYYGNPPQKQTVIIDTASDLLTTPCDKC